MKKERITFFGLGAVIGLVVGIAIGVPIDIRKPANETNLAEETVYSEDTNSHEFASNTEVKEPASVKTESETSNYEVPDEEPEEVKPIRLKDENGEFTKEALELAEEYLVKYNNDEWDGYSIVDSRSGIEIGAHWGIIRLGGEDTPIRTEERIICDKAIESYMSGEWDGTEMTIPEGHTIKLTEGGGYLLLDGHIEAGQRNLDIPESAYELFRNDIPDYEYVPGQGTYVIINNRLVKFLRGEQINLPGGTLSWKGFKNRRDLDSKIEIDSRIMYDLPNLIYNNIDGKLYLTTGDETCDLNNSENYVYVFDDCNRSEMRYIGRADFEHEYPGNVDMNSVIIQ